MSPQLQGCLWPSTSVPCPAPPRPAFALLLGFGIWGASSLDDELSRCELMRVAIRLSICPSSSARNNDTCRRPTATPPIHPICRHLLSLYGVPS
ncbi:hypothetical protein BGZ61DRAFT_450643 [Ilyonectria robusta]|uniref:uncharacterized protein n=1 Tax=Ilyonectria robusta TaxID=1079257 RepID=UPI001E8D9F72|nr:uncharacterized protein BGZ61DRAFT_450643 [Ilyonectria robusta]KAH8706845.1 hypothetical protein BGZ61DRAFT_450643 [Ilyonectria robusta]